jgi:hypothetical protein
MTQYEIPDLIAVLTPIQAALVGVLQAYGFLNNMTGTVSLLNSVSYQQDKDLGKVLGNMVVEPTDSTVGYWSGQIVDAVLWGVAAAPLGPAGQVVGAMAASLFGSLLASQSISPPGPLSYSEFKSTIVDQDYADATKAVAAVYQSLSTDPVKLSLLAPLIENVWPWTATMAQTVADATSDYNRIFFYQLLMPKVFVI